jgi:hypothetical protein
MDGVSVWAAADFLEAAYRAEEIETWLTAPIGEASLQSDRGL